MPFIWKLDLLNRTLQQLSETLNVARHSASCVVLNNKLYVLGGLNAQNKQLNDFECLDLSQVSSKQGKMYMSASKVVALQPMQAGGSPLSVCTFKQKFIIKSSYHLTEIYDMSRWVAMRLSISPDCGMVQVNPSSVLVFGGGHFALLRMNHKQELTLDQLPESSKISKYKVANGSLIHQGRIFAEALQGGIRVIAIGKEDHWIV